LQKVEYSPIAKSINGLTTYSTVELNTYSRSIVLELKENRSRSAYQFVAKHLAFLINDITLEQQLSCISLIPLPSPRANLYKRGYNHLQLLIKNIQNFMIKEMNVDKGSFVSSNFKLTYSRKVAEQRGLSAAQRQVNLFGSMKVQSSGIKKIVTLASKGSHLSLHNSSTQLILVDDVLTTGSTMREAYRALKEANIEPLCGVSFASTPYLQGK
jgi:predicted amidophosphoribosyltransferase